MSKKAVYQLSARQILFLALASAFITAGVVIAISGFGNVWQARDFAGVALAEYAPAGISEPSAVSDEQNNI